MKHCLPIELSTPATDQPPAGEYRSAHRTEAGDSLQDDVQPELKPLVVPDTSHYVSHGSDVRKSVSGQSLQVGADLVHVILGFFSLPQALLEGEGGDIETEEVTDIGRKPVGHARIG
jgi:hypothetical protein